MATDQQTREGEQHDVKASARHVRRGHCIEIRLWEKKLEERQEVEGEQREKVGARQIPQTTLQIHQHAADKAYANANGRVTCQVDRSAAEECQRRDQHRAEREYCSHWRWSG